MLRKLNEKNLLLYAAQNYKNPRFSDIEEFHEDLKRLTYCMKDVYNWKIYCDLYRSFNKVDYTQLLETEDNTTGIEEISCAGGACLI